MAKDSSADYYGVGPWRFTNTKKKLATILGRAGVQHLVEILKKDRPDREIVAIGGIGFEDIKDVMLTGADGIAVSGLITKSENPALTTQRIIEEIYKQKRNI